MSGREGTPPLRVLHLTNLLFAGGAELHLLALATGLRRRGVEVTVAPLVEPERWRNRPLAPEFERAGVEVAAPAGCCRVDARMPLRVAALLRRTRPHILHTHLPWSDLVGAAAAAASPGAARVCSVHDIYRRHSSEYRALPAAGVAWRRARAVVAISGAVREWLVRERGVPGAKVKVVPYGIDPGPFERSPAADPRATWGVAGRPVVGTVGRLEPRKGHDVLIRAMAGVVRQSPSACLLVAGHDPGGYAGELRALAARAGLEGAVKLVGFQEDVPAFLHALDVFAFASRSEGFGQVVIEAMAAGKAVVASRIAPLTEIVVDGETGLLADPGDEAGFARALTRLLADPGEARRMGSRGRERVRRLFSAERMVEEILGLYDGLIRARRAVGR